MTSPTFQSNGQASPLVRFNPFEEVGVSGVNRQSGYVFDEPLQELRGVRRAAVIRQMTMNDPTIGALLYAIKMLIRQVTWRVEAGSTDAEGEQLRELVETAMFEDMETSWENTLADVISFLPWGWELSELCYKRRSGDSRDPALRSKFSDGMVGWAKWPIRSQETLFRWQFDERGVVSAMEQLAPPVFDLRVIPMEKALLFQTEPNRGNPEGYSILRNAYRPWKMKTRIENLEGVGVERDLAGLPVMYIPDTYMSQAATAEQKAVYDYAKKLVTNIRNDEQGGVVMPMSYDAEGRKQFELTLLSSGGVRRFDTDRIVTRYDQRILMSVMADFLLLGAGRVGSLALSSDKTELFGIALGATLDNIASLINANAIPRLLRLNGKPTDKPPTLAHGDVESPDLAELADFISKTIAAGALTPDPGLEEYLRQVAHLPELPDDFEAPAPLTDDLPEDTIDDMPEEQPTDASQPA